MLANAARQAFSNGLAPGCTVATTVALAGAVMVTVLLPAKPKKGESTSVA